MIGGKSLEPLRLNTGYIMLRRSVKRLRGSQIQVKSFMRVKIKIEAQTPFIQERKEMIIKFKVLMKKKSY